MSCEKTTEEAPASPEIHFEPIVSLPKVELKSTEENEDEVLSLRAKLYRYDNSGDEKEWKERGTGEVRILKHRSTGACRILMRRDKTLKICANHLITNDMQLKPNCNSDRAWVWTVAADFADNEASAQTLAIRFGNAENAKKFKDKFEECQTQEQDDSKKESDKLAQELEGLKVKETGEGEEKKNEDKNGNEEKTNKDKAESPKPSTKEEKDAGAEGSDVGK